MIKTIWLAVAIAVAPWSALAFGTINGLGQNAEHERITRSALRPYSFGAKTLSEIAGKRGTFGAVGAPDNPLRGLMSTSIAHCDGGDALATPGYPQSSAAALKQLSRCRQWIFRHLNNAVRFAGGLVNKSGRVDATQIPRFFACVYNGKRGRAKCNVLDALGVAFHAAQDFYSHTNWTDRAAPRAIGPLNPPGLGQRGRAPWLDPRLRKRAPIGLMSGCYEGIPESRYCTYGDRKLRVRHAALNKDKGLIDVKTGRARGAKTSRGLIKGNFARAVTAAIDDTRNKWAYFEQRVRAVYGAKRGRLIICAMKKDNPGMCRQSR